MGRMIMAHKWSDIRRKHAPEVEERIRKEVKDAAKVMTLHQLREGYPVRLRKDGKFILVTFPDIPEAITQGDNRAHALKMAKEVLEVALEFYFDEKRPVPMPSQARRGQAVVEVAPSLTAKILLL